jgi:KDO2-lipid IV(A) lauroyltransferase
MKQLGIALLWLLWRLLPDRVLGQAGEMLGAALFVFARERRHIGATNLRLCFPELDDAARNVLLKRHFRAFGRAALLETVCWWGKREDIVRLVRIEGMEHLVPYRGGPVVLFTTHFVGVSAGGIRLTCELAPMVDIYSPIKNPLLNRLAHRARQRFGESELYSRSEGIRPVLKAVKRGLPFYYLPDMDYGRKDALFVPLFGVPAATITGLSRIAHATKAAVIPTVTREDSDGYVIRLYPAWENFPTDDVEADTRRMNAFIEDRIREMPEQYFWLHKRFKTRPVGEASLYG